jgi:hypothetical protein
MSLVNSVNVFLNGNISLRHLVFDRLNTFIQPWSSKTNGSVVIQTSQQPHVITKYIVGDDRLSELEAAWLTKEIQDWLKNAR